MIHQHYNEVIHKKAFERKERIWKIYFAFTYKTESKLRTVTKFMTTNVGIVNKSLTFVLKNARNNT